MAFRIKLLLLAALATPAASTEAPTCEGEGEGCLCEETCYSGVFVADGACDDGGEGSLYSCCSLGAHARAPTPTVYPPAPRKTPLLAERSPQPSRRTRGPTYRGTTHPHPHRPPPQPLPPPHATPPTRHPPNTPRTPQHTLPHTLTNPPSSAARRRRLHRLWHTLPDPPDAAHSAAAAAAHQL